MTLLISLPESLYIQESDQQNPLCGLEVSLTGGRAGVCFQVGPRFSFRQCRRAAVLQHSCLSVSPLELVLGPISDKGTYQDLVQVVT